jgi:hypothetical protein
MVNALRTSTGVPVLLQDAELAAISPADMQMTRGVSHAQLRRVIDDLSRRAENTDLWASYVRTGFWIVAREYQQELDGR